MDQLTYQRAFMRMSFAREPEPCDLAAVGVRDSALLYRHMIRTRLGGMAKVAFKASLGALGDDAFERCFESYLAEAPPHSALIREVIADFGPFARAVVRQLESPAPYLADLLRFEESKWRLGYAEAALPDPARVSELAFEGAPAWNPLLVLLSLTHSVHTFDGGELPAAPCELLMYRPAGSDEVRWYKADPFFAGLLCAARESPNRSFGELVPRLARARQIPVDQALLESLATSLTLAIERGVLLGVLDRS